MGEFSMSIIYPLATRAGIGLAAALALSVGAAHALISDLDRFELFNNCGPVSVSIEDLAPDAAKIGLTKDSLQAAVESRLRIARLYDPAYSPPIPVPESYRIAQCSLGELGI